KAYGTHQSQCVALLDHARMEAIVENHTAILELILKMKVGRPRCQRVGQLGKSEIVRRDETYCAAIDQAADNGLGSDGAIVRVGSVEYFIQQKEHRHLFRELHDVVQALDF